MFGFRPSKRPRRLKITFNRFQRVRPRRFDELLSSVLCGGKRARLYIRRADGIVLRGTVPKDCSREFGTVPLRPGRTERPAVEIRFVHRL